MRSRGRRLHDGIVEVYGAMIARVKARLDAGEDVPDCVAKTLILTQEQENLDWEDMCMLAAVFTLGGIHSVGFNFIYPGKYTAAKSKIVTTRLRALSCGFWLSSRHIPKSKLALMQNLTK